jgi:hypothetical protein
VSTLLPRPSRRRLVPRAVPLSLVSSELGGGECGGGRERWSRRQGARNRWKAGGGGLLLDGEERWRAGGQRVAWQHRAAARRSSSEPARGWRQVGSRPAPSHRRRRLGPTQSAEPRADQIREIGMVARRSIVVVAATPPWLYDLTTRANPLSPVVRWPQDHQGRCLGRQGHHPQGPR